MTVAMHAWYTVAVRGRSKRRQSWRLDGKRQPSIQGDRALAWDRSLFPSRARRCEGADGLAMRRR